MKMRRLTAYVAGSVTLATAVVSWAAIERPNFYSAAVYLSQSNACLMILCNLALVLAAGLGYGLQQLLFGPLRVAEVEQLWERGWFAVMEWVFAMSTFRDEFGIWFLTMFLSLFSGKVWGWIAEGRVEQLEQQPPANGQLFKPRLILSLTIYLLFAIQMFMYCLDIVLYEARPGMTVMFLFEFAILCICAVSTCVRYGIWIKEHRVLKHQMARALEARKAEIRAAHQAAAAQANSEGTEANAIPFADLPNEEDVDENEVDVPGWEAKRGWLFTLDITTDLLKLLAYIAFFTILTVFYGIPIYIIRDLYMTVRSFSKRITDYIQYTKATKDMHARYPDATAGEIASDNTCIVCREEMRPWGGDNPQAAGGVPAMALPGTTTNERQRPKKLPCGHILHFNCLQSWLERQQSCPTCRRSVFAIPTVRGAQGPDANAQAPAAGAAPNNANAAHNGAAVQPRNGAAGQPRPARRNEGRVFRFGPIRLQFGGRRDDQVELINILERMARDRAAHQQNNQQNNAAPGAPRVRFGVQQIQEAHVHGRDAAATSNIHPAVRSLSTAVQLNMIEEQLNQQITAANLSLQQLNIMRGMQRELERLRSQGVQLQLPLSLAQPQGVPPPLQSFSSRTVPIARAAESQSQSAILPQGMVLPPGWNLVPLSPIPVEVPPSTRTTELTAGEASSSGPSTAAQATANSPSGLTILFNGAADGTSSTVPAAPPTNTFDSQNQSAGLGTPATEVSAPSHVPSATWSFPATGGESSETGSAPKTASEPSLLQSQTSQAGSSSSKEKQPTVEDAKED